MKDTMTAWIKLGGRILTPRGPGRVKALKVALGEAMEVDVEIDGAGVVQFLAIELRPLKPPKIVR